MKRVVKIKKKENRKPKLVLHKLDWLEWTTIGISVCFLFFPSFFGYQLLFSILVVIPIFGLILNGINRPSIASLVEIHLDKDRYDVADFIDIAAWVILFRMLIDYDYESFYKLIIPVTIGFVLVLLVLFATHKMIQSTNKNKAWIYTSLIFNLFIYSFAATYGINCVYDYSSPQKYEVKIIEKQIRKGKRSRKSYYIKPEMWGNGNTRCIQISKTKYSRLKEGDLVSIARKDGVLGIPWYYLE